jgi:hypothetical protein
LSFLPLNSVLKRRRNCLRVEAVRLAARSNRSDDLDVDAQTELMIARSPTRIRSGAEHARQIQRRPAVPAGAEKPSAGIENASGAVVWL